MAVNTASLFIWTADALLDAHKRNVRIRIISDDDQMASTGSDVQRLKDAGIAGVCVCVKVCYACYVIMSDEPYCT